MVEEVVQEVQVGTTPKLLPPRIGGSQELEPEEAARLVREWVEPLLSDPEDLETFEARRGVTFIADLQTKKPLLELFLRDRVFLIPVAHVAGALERGTKEVFARGVLDRLRDRFHHTPQSYSRMELLFEVLYEMRDLLPDGVPECHDFPENSSAHIRRQINEIKARVKKLTGQKVKQAMTVGRRG